MKNLSKWLLAVIMLCSTTGAHAQSEDSDWALNTRGWSTNYFTTVMYGLAKYGIIELVTSNDKDSVLLRRILPSAALVLPVGLKKEGFDYPYDIYGPYHRAFSNPFSRIGDYGIGIDVAWTPSVLGLYAGAYFKSQEIVFKETQDNLRGFYFQPRAGISVNFGEKHNSGLEAGVFYDVVTGCGGKLPGAEKDMLKGGMGLDFAIKTYNKKRNIQGILQFSMPLHNFLNKDYQYGITKGMDRRVGYIMLSSRMKL